MANQNQSLVYGWNPQKLGASAGQSGYAQEPTSLGVSEATDNYLLGWTNPPEFYTSNCSPTLGEVYLQRVTAVASGPITNLYFFVTSAGSSMTASANYAGIYTLSGANLILGSSSGDISTAWTSSHVATHGAGPGITLTTSQTVTAGQYFWIAEVFNSTGTAPQLAGGAQSYWDQPSIGAGVSNWVSPATPYTLAPRGFRYASYSSGVTSLPSSIPLNLCNPDKAFFAGAG